MKWRTAPASHVLLNDDRRAREREPKLGYACTCCDICLLTGPRHTHAVFTQLILAGRTTRDKRAETQDMFDRRLRVNVGHYPTAIESEKPYPNLSQVTGS